MPISTANVATATASVSSEVAGMCCATLTTSRKNPCLVMWMPRSFGTWSSTITSPIPALKPVSTGAEMKFATKPSFMQPRQHQQRADQRGQRGGRGDELRRVAVRHRQPELRAGEDRQRGRRTDAQHARRAQQRVDDHRDEGGIQADGDGQPGDRRVRHRLRQNDRGGREAGDHVEAQCRWRRRACIRRHRCRVHRICSRGLGIAREGGSWGASRTSRRACRRTPVRSIPG